MKVGLYQTPNGDRRGEADGGMAMDAMDAVDAVDAMDGDARRAAHTEQRIMSGRR